MAQIIRKMQYDVHPPTQSKTKVLSMSHRYHVKVSLIIITFMISYFYHLFYVTFVLYFYFY